MSVPNQQGHCPLWAALASGQEDIAHILVRYGKSRKLILRLSSFSTISFPLIIINIAKF